MAARSMDKAVFLDRDGTINRDVPYCSRPEDLELLPTVAEGIKLLNEHGFKVVVVTNQSGIARGYFTEETLSQIHQKMLADLAQYGAFIDAIYYCPHHPDEHCQCRKPNTAGFEQVARELDIDLKASFVIGDKLRDMIAAKRVGSKAILVPSSEPEINLLRGSPASEGEADFICSDFYTAASWIVAHAR